MKVKLRAVPVMLGAGVLAGVLTLAYACYGAFFNPDAPTLNQSIAVLGRTMLIVSASLPFVVYWILLLGYLLLDLCRAVLDR